jgi:hypothetical protein
MFHYYGCISASFKLGMHGAQRVRLLFWLNMSYLNAFSMCTCHYLALGFQHI